MPTSSQILAVRDDVDLRERIIALASLDDRIAHPQSWVDERIYKLAGVPVEGDQTIASVLEYARHEYRPYGPNPIRPGVNSAAVRDDHILTAIDALVEPEGA